MFQGWAITGTLALIASLMLSGCADAGCTASNDMSGQVAVCNKKGTFAYSVNAGMTSKTDSYTWENGQTKSRLSWSSNLGMGSVSVVVKDADGKQVLSKSYSGTGQRSETTTSSTGTAGSWTIEVRLSAASGQVALEIDGV